MENYQCKGFSSIYGQWRDFFFRKETNDENTILAVFVEDEYHLKQTMNFDGGVVIDVGAHIGSFSLLAASCPKPVKVYAIESCPENHEILQMNIKRNKLEEVVKTYLRAGWRNSGEYLRLYYGDDSEFGKQHKFNTSYCHNWGRTDKNLSYDVETIDLKTIFEENKIEHCNVLKLDCEGAEWEILKNTSKEIFSKIDYIVGEYHNLLKPAYKNPRQKLKDLLPDFFIDEDSAIAGDVIHQNILPDFPYHGDFLYKNKMIEINKLT